MSIISALKEFSKGYGVHHKLQTPGGNWSTILDVWVEEIMAEDNGYDDPNEYIVKADGIYYMNSNYELGGKAYGV